MDSLGNCYKHFIVFFFRAVKIDNLIMQCCLEQSNFRGKRQFSLLCDQGNKVSTFGHPPFHPHEAVQYFNTGS